MSRAEPFLRNKHDYSGSHSDGGQFNASAGGTNSGALIGLDPDMDDDEKSTCCQVIKSAYSRYQRSELNQAAVALCIGILFTDASDALGKSITVPGNLFAVPYLWIFSTVPTMFKPTDKDESLEMTTAFRAFGFYDTSVISAVAGETAMVMWGNQDAIDAFGTILPWLFTILLASLGSLLLAQRKGKYFDITLFFTQSFLVCASDVVKTLGYNFLPPETCFLIAAGTKAAQAGRHLYNFFKQAKQENIDEEKSSRNFNLPPSSSYSVRRQGLASGEYGSLLPSSSSINVPILVMPSTSPNSLASPSRFPGVKSVVSPGATTDSQRPEIPEDPAKKSYCCIL